MVWPGGGTHSVGRPAAASPPTVVSLCCRPDELSEAARARGNRGPHAVFLLTRWRMFWGAPVTVFLGNVLMYFAFLFLFAYVLLVDFRPPPQGPSGAEVTLYFWVFTLVLEEIRQVSGGLSPRSPDPSSRLSPDPRRPRPGVGRAVSGELSADGLPLCQGFFRDEDTHLVKKFALYVEDNWNKCDMTAIFLFVVGVTCRSVGPRGLTGAPSVGPVGGATCRTKPRKASEIPASLWHPRCVSAGSSFPSLGTSSPSNPAPSPRMEPSVFEAGRTVLAVDFMVFTLRLIHIFAIHKQLGPKIIIVERMVSPGRSWACPGPRRRVR